MSLLFNLNRVIINFRNAFRRQENVAVANVEIIRAGQKFLKVDVHFAVFAESLHVRVIGQQFVFRDAPHRKDHVVVFRRQEIYRHVPEIVVAFDLARRKVVRAGDQLHFGSRSVVVIGVFRAVVGDCRRILQEQFAVYLPGRDLLAVQIGNDLLDRFRGAELAVFFERIDHFVFHVVIHVAAADAIRRKDGDRKAFRLHGRAALAEAVAHCHEIERRVVFVKQVACPQRHGPPAFLKVHTGVERAVERLRGAVVFRPVDAPGGIVAHVEADAIQQLSGLQREDVLRSRIQRVAGDERDAAAPVVHLFRTAGCGHVVVAEGGVGVAVSCFERQCFRSPQGERRFRAQAAATPGVACHAAHAVGREL